MVTQKRPVASQNKYPWKFNGKRQKFNLMYKSELCANLKEVYMQIKELGEIKKETLSRPAL